MTGSTKKRAPTRPKGVITSRDDPDYPIGSSWIYYDCGDEHDYKAHMLVEIAGYTTTKGSDMVYVKVQEIRLASGVAKETIVGDVILVFTKHLSKNDDS